MRVCRVLLVLAALSAGPAMSSVVASEGQPPQPPPDFVPVENAPAGEQIPAMPLLGLAYGFIWVGVLGYVWSIARRLSDVESELAELESRRK
jgi:CcmD family protein